MFWAELGVCLINLIRVRGWWWAYGVWQSWLRQAPTTRRTKDQTPQSAPRNHDTKNKNLILFAPADHVKFVPAVK